LVDDEKRIFTGWEKVEARVGSNIPCQRSLHAAAVCGDSLFVFGGYDGL